MTLPTPPPGFLPQTATSLQRMQQRLEHAFPSNPPPLLRQPKCTAEHRGPQGPNEDMGLCPSCWSPTWARRPAGETFGWHADDCSLPADHLSHCEPGGAGHPLAETIRGYWPHDPRSPDYRSPT